MCQLILSLYRLILLFLTYLFFRKTCIHGKRNLLERSGLEDVLKTPSSFVFRGRILDFLIKTNINTLVTSSQNVFQTSSNDVFKTSSSGNTLGKLVLLTLLQDVSKTSSRRFPDVFKTLHLRKNCLVTKCSTPF